MGVLEGILRSGFFDKGALPIQGGLKMLPLSLLFKRFLKLGAVAYGGLTSSGGTFTTGSSLVYDPVSAAGKYAYICLNGTNTFLRFNAASRVLQRWAQLRFAQSTATAGQKMAFAPFVDGSTKAGFVYTIRSSGNEFFNCLIHR